jgi:protein-disulfide isomerase
MRPGRHPDELEDELAHSHASHTASGRLAFVLVVPLLLLLTLTVPGTGAAAPPFVRGAGSTAALLRGIPQHGTALGRSDAPVTLVEFADVQCPYCALWARNALPTLVREYVRSGKVRIVFTGMHFVGPDSVTGLNAALAAAAQNRFWHVLELLYQNQGRENSGWISDALLRAIGHTVPGLDTARMMRDRRSAAVEHLLAAADAFALRAGVRATPTFAVGRRGGTLAIVQVKSLTAAALRPALDRALKG